MSFRIKSKYVDLPDAELQVGRYGNGALALVAIPSDDPWDRVKLSVNLAAYGMVPPDDEHFYVLDYSIAEGLPAALEEAGIAEPIGEPVQIGHGVGQLMHLLVPVDSLTTL